MEKEQINYKKLSKDELRDELYNTQAEILSVNRQKQKKLEFWNGGVDSKLVKIALALTIVLGAFGLFSILFAQFALSVIGLLGYTSMFFSFLMFASINEIVGNGFIKSFQTRKFDNQLNALHQKENAIYKEYSKDFVQEADVIKNVVVEENKVKYNKLATHSGNNLKQENKVQEFSK